MRLLTALLLSLTAALPAAASPFVDLEKPEAYQLMVQGFEVDRPATVAVEAVGRSAPDEAGSWLKVWRSSREEDEILTVYGWILDASSREPVWVMEAHAAERLEGALRRVQDRVALEPGRYEAWFYSGHGWMEGKSEGKGRYGWGRSWSSEREALEEDLPRCHLRLSTEDASPRLYTPDGKRPDALISFTEVGDSQLRRAGLLVEAPSRLRVRALLEFPKGSRAPADYGWIVDAEDRSVVFDTAEALNRRAGGSRKNRLVDEEITLPPGRYEVYYGTDDSHSWPRFNANPPFDPMGWGLSLFPLPGARLGVYEPAPPEEPFLDLTPAGDDAFRQAHFRMPRAGEVRLRALGEYDYDDRNFVDRAWLVDETTGETAWEMTVPTPGAPAAPRRTASSTAWSPCPPGSTASSM